MNQDNSILLELQQRLQNSICQDRQVVTNYKWNQKIHDEQLIKLNDNSLQNFSTLNQIIEKYGQSIQLEKKEEKLFDIEYFNKNNRIKIQSLKQMEQKIQESQYLKHDSAPYVCQNYMQMKMPSKQIENRSNSKNLISERNQKKNTITNPHPYLKKQQASFKPPAQKKRCDSCSVLNKK